MDSLERWCKSVNSITRLTNPKFKVAEKVAEYEAKITTPQYEPDVRHFRLDTGEVVEVKHCGNYVRVSLKDAAHYQAPAIISSNGHQYDVGPAVHFINNKAEDAPDGAKDE